MFFATVTYSTACHPAKYCISAESYDTKSDLG